MQISDILSVEGADSFTRPIYAGNAIVTVTTSDTKLVLTVRTTAFDKASPEGGSGTIEKVASTGDAGLSAFAGAEIAKLERPELTSAKVIVSGGRALQSSENFKTLIEPLARSEEHTSEIQSLMRISYAVFCLKKKKNN